MKSETIKTIDEQSTKVTPDGVVKVNVDVIARPWGWQPSACSWARWGRPVRGRGSGRHRG